MRDDRGLFRWRKPRTMMHDHDIAALFWENDNDENKLKAEMQILRSSSPAATVAKVTAAILMNLGEEKAWSFIGFMARHVEK